MDMEDFRTFIGVRHLATRPVDYSYYRDRAGYNESVARSSGKPASKEGLDSEHMQHR